MNDPSTNEIPNEADDATTSFSELFKEHIDPNETLNTFLNDLHENELKLNVRFTDKEIGDIREAVEEQVKHIAQRIEEIDPRLKIAETIPVGSARERTQVIRPCEYDFIIILDWLSQSGVTAVTDSKHGYVKVKLEDDQLLSKFKDIVTDDGLVRGTNSLFHRGLRQLIDKTIEKVLCDRSTIKKDTGTLTCQRQLPVPNGVAIPITLTWTNGVDKRPLLVSVDLCPAIKAYDVKDFMASDIHESYSGYTAQLNHILIMPIKPFHFKVTFTEMEVRLTTDMSEHHKYCYKIIKYIVNGEPYPLENNERTLLKCVKVARTNMKSYMIKLAMWNHHYEHKCSEEINVGFCVSQILESLQFNTFEHPFSHIKFMEVYELQVAEYHRIEPLRKCFQDISETSTEDYSYEKSSSDIEKVDKIICFNIRSYIPDAITLVLQVTTLAIFCGFMMNFVEDHLTEKTVIFIIFLTAFSLHIFFSFHVSCVRNKILSLCSCRVSEFQTDALMVSVVVTAIVTEIVSLIAAMIYTKEGVLNDWVWLGLAVHMNLCMAVTCNYALSVPSVRRKKTKNPAIPMDRHPGIPCFPCGPVLCYPPRVYPGVYYIPAQNTA